MKTILVTGGGGFLGSAIARMLLKRGDCVHVLYRGHHPEIEKENVEIFQGDIADIELVKKAVKGCDAVIHTAAKAGIWGKYKDYYRTNVEGTENIIEACLTMGVEKLVYTSSPSVAYGEKGVEGANESIPYPEEYESYYSKTKSKAEHLILGVNNLALATCALRPHLIWGPGDNHLIPRIIAKAKKRKLRIVGQGNNLIDSIYIENAAYAHILALDALAYGKAPAGKVYFLSQDEPLPAKVLINKILDAAGLPPVEKHISLPLAYFIGYLCETIYSSLDISIEPPMTRFLAHQLSSPHWFNIQAAKKDFGYAPFVSIEEGMRRLKEWFKTHG